MVGVRPATASTQYDIKIVDEDSFTMYERTSEIGELAEEVLLPIKGIYTITISNATNDELFNFNIVIREAWQ